MISSLFYWVFIFLDRLVWVLIGGTTQYEPESNRELSSIKLEQQSVVWSSLGHAFIRCWQSMVSRVFPKIQFSKFLSMFLSSITFSMCLGPLVVLP